MAKTGTQRHDEPCLELNLPGRLTLQLRGILYYLESILMRTTVSLCGAGLLAALAFAPANADWPQFRGPAGDGVSKDEKLPVEWSPTKNVAWKQSIPGRGWSSPVVHEGKIYLTTAVMDKSATSDKTAAPNKAGAADTAGAADKSAAPTKAAPAVGPSLRTICLSADTGKQLWDTEVFTPVTAASKAIHGKNSHASPTPLLIGDRLYVHFGHQGTACLSLDGKVIWRNQKLTYNPVHGNGGSPIVVDDLLIYSADGGNSRFVIALDRATGELRWKTAREWPSSSQFSFSTPLLITVTGQKQVISAGSDGVVSYNPADGKEIWRVRYQGYSVIPKPVFANGLVYVCTGYNIPYLMAIRPDGQGNVTKTHVAWTFKKGVPATPSVLVVGDELYMVSDAGMATCLDAKTGTVHWQNRLGGHYSASPLCANGRIYFQSEEGVGTVIKAGTKFEQVAKNELNESSLASYAVADGALFVRTEHNLYRIQTQ
jgi:outer membrane protein assembly factor BamB